MSIDLFNRVKVALSKDIILACEFEYWIEWYKKEGEKINSELTRVRDAALQIKEEVEVLAKRLRDTEARNADLEEENKLLRDRIAEYMWYVAGKS